MSYDAAPTYEASAEYILAEIKRAGLKSPRRILKLVEQLHTLTKFAATAERFADFYINDSMVIDIKHYPPITLTDIERAEPMPWLEAILCTHEHDAGEPCGGYPRPRTVHQVGCHVWCERCERPVFVRDTGRCVRCDDKLIFYPPGLLHR